MPYPSLKKLVKRTCEAWFEVVALNDLAEDELWFLQAVLGCTTEEEIIDQLLRGHDSEVLSKVYSLAHSARYLALRLRQPKTRAYMAAIFPLLSEVDFKQHCRMNRASFRTIVQLIEGHQVFHNDSDFEQIPIELQLACALERLGTNGNGASLGNTKRLYGVGAGTVALFTDRVVTALVDLAPRVVKWPSPAIRDRIREDLAPEGFPGCVGFIDGTTIPLAQRPGRCGETYLDRKRRYSVNMPVICDHRRSIIATCGYPGSCADITVFRTMDIANEPAAFFREGEYLLADSAYPTWKTVVPVYKGQLARTEDNKQFNMCTAHASVVNENCIGVLKGRFSSLREMRVLRATTAEADMARFCKWVTACLVLHNLLVEMNDPWEDEDQEAVEPDGGGGELQNDGSIWDAEEGRAFREQVRRTCLDIQRADFNSFLNFRLENENSP